MFRFVLIICDNKLKVAAKWESYLDVDKLKVIQEDIHILFSERRASACFYGQQI